MTNGFGQKGKVPLSERLSVSPEEASALTGIGLTSILELLLVVRRRTRFIVGPIRQAGIHVA